MTRLDGEPSESDRSPQVTTSKMTFPDSDPLADQVSSFVHAIVNGAKPVVSGDDGRRALEVSLAIMDQIEKGCRDFKTIC